MPDDETPTEGAAPATGGDLSDDQILDQMKAERQAKRDKELLGEGDDEPSKGKAGKAGKTPPEPAAEDEGDDLDEDDDPEDLDEDEEDDDEPAEADPKNLQKARKLFDKGDVKGALKAALGLSDDDLEAKGDWEDPKFVNAKFRAFRAKVNRTEEEFAEKGRAQDEREQKFTTYVENLGKRLTPAFEWFKLQKQYQETGDTSLLVQAMEAFSGEAYDIAQKKVLRNEKRSPTDARLLAKITELEAKLEKVGQPKEQTPEEKQEAARQQVKEYLGEIKEQIADHDVRKIPGAAKKVLQVLRKKYDAKLKAPSISIEKAADIVLRRHMRLVRSLAPEAATETPAANANAGHAPRKVVAHPRSQTREAAPANDDPSDDEILRQIEIERAQRRREAQKRAGGAR